jgi:hypothetical protein
VPFYHRDPDPGSGMIFFPDPESRISDPGSLPRPKFNISLRFYL